MQITITITITIEITIKDGKQIIPNQELQVEKLWP